MTRPPATSRPSTPKMAAGTTQPKSKRWWAGGRSALSHSVTDEVLGKIRSRRCPPLIVNPRLRPTNSQHALAR
jgi:hypothetical protein